MCEGVSVDLGLVDGVCDRTRRAAAREERSRPGYLLPYWVILPQINSL